VLDIENSWQSPEIRLKNVPKGVKSLQIQFFDDSARWDHGVGRLNYEGSGIIHAGAVKEYKGFSPTLGFPRVEVIVRAFNKDDQLIAKGAMIKGPIEE